MTLSQSLLWPAWNLFVEPAIKKACFESTPPDIILFVVLVVGLNTANFVYEFTSKIGSELFVA